MKNFTTLFRFFCNAAWMIFLLAVTPANAQLPAPQWDTAIGTWGGNYQNGGGIKAGWDNNIYISYRYTGIINLNPVAPASGCGTAIGTAQLTNKLRGNWATRVQQSCGDDYAFGFNIDDKLNSYAVGTISSASGWYCSKTNVTGILKWDFTVSGGLSYSSGVCADKTGHVYICGGYSSTMNIGSNTLSYLGGGTDGFLTKIDSNENVLWAVPLHGSGNDCITRCAMDYLGHVWVCGGYTGAPTFGTITLPTSSVYPSLFVAEYDTATGNCLTVYTAINCGTNGILSDGYVSMVIDSCNNMYITGPYQDTARWGTFSAINSSGHANFYVAKMRPNGAFQWVQTSSSASAESGFELTLDKNWDITTTGMFDNSATFSGQLLTGSSQGSVFAAKYAGGNGAFMYAEAGGGTSAQTGGAQIAADTNRQIYIIGSYYTASPVFNLVTLPWGGDQAIYIAKLDSTPSLRIVPNAQVSYCAGKCYTLPFTAIYDSATGNFRAGNLFTAQLSDVTGSFASGGLNIGSLSGTTTGSINICIPDTITPGSNYQIRISSSSPAYCSIVRCNTVTINPLPIISINTVPPICQGDSATFTASGGVSYSWSNGDTASSIVVKPIATTTYSVSVSNGTCSKDTSVTLTVNPMPAITLSGTTSVCAGDSTLITASGGGTYLWSNGKTSSAVSFKPAATTTYTVTVSNGACSTDTAITLTVTSKPVPTISSAPPVCAGSTVSLTASGGTTYLWNTGETSSAISVIPPATTTYTVTVSNGSCSATDSTKVTVIPSPLATACCSTTIAAGDSTPITVTLGAGYTYTWWPASGLSCTICANPVASPTVTTWYHVTVTDSAGCTVTDSVLITVKENCGAVYVPNAFSPNADGYNDVLYVYGNCIKTIDFRIYDRWGNKVFESSDPKIGWNGTFHGQLMNTGTYVYTLTVLDFNNNTTTKKGNIALVR